MPLDACVLVSAKRGKFERGGVHGWHPYYAGYSEAFVASALKHLQCGSSSVVLDPWCGSGTTLAVASREGVPSIGLDINPAMATFSGAKSQEVLAFDTKIQAFFDQLAPITPRSKLQAWADDPLLTALDVVTTTFVRGVVEQIPFGASIEAGGDVEDADLDVRPQSSSLIEAYRVIDPCHAFCISVIFVVLREALGGQKLSNPTWLKNNKDPVALDVSALIVSLRATCRKMLQDLRHFFESNLSGASSLVTAADARNIPISGNVIDAVITSPPYLTRIDYAVSTQLELSLFSDASMLAFVRHNTMGAPVITKSIKEQSPKWGTTCNAILEKIRTHDTKAAASYYWKNIVQYFSDAYCALRELHRVMKVGGKGLIVVQSSYFKEIEIPLGAIYVEMAQEIGFSSRVAYSEAVKQHMAHINTKSTAYKSDKTYFEDFVEITKIN